MLEPRGHKPLPRKPITGIAGYCARAVSGHPATLLPTSAMKSRRLMGLTPKAKDHELIIAQCIAARSGHFCPLWVISGRNVTVGLCPL